MAAKIIEGFDAYSNISTIGAGRKFRIPSGSGQLTFTTGRYGGRALRIGGSGTDSSNRALALVMQDPVQGNDTLIVGFALYLEALTGNAQSIVQYATAGALHLMIALTDSGYLTIRNSDGDILATSSSTFLQPGNWYYIELEIFLSSSVGTVSVFINPTPTTTVADLAWTGNTLPAGGTEVNELILGTIAANFGGNDQRGNVTGAYDDIYVFDDTGSTNNARLGGARIETLYPTTTDTNDMATTGASTAHEALDDGASGSPDGDTTYVSSPVAGQRVLVGTTDTISGVPIEIYAVGVSYIGRKDGAAGLNFDKIIRSDATEASQVSSSLLDTHTTEYDTVFPLDPDGDIAWTKTKVQALLWGAEVN